MKARSRERNEENKRRKLANAQRYRARARHGGATTARYHWRAGEINAPDNHYTSYRQHGCGGWQQKLRAWREKKISSMWQSNIIIVMKHAQKAAAPLTTSAAAKASCALHTRTHTREKAKKKKRKMKAIIDNGIIIINTKAA